MLTLFKLGFDVVVILAAFYGGIKVQQKHSGIIAKIPFLKP